MAGITPKTTSLSRRAVIQASLQTIFQTIFQTVIRSCAALAIVGLGTTFGAPVPRAAATEAARAPDPATARERVDAARRETDAVARRYFAQLGRYEVLGTEIDAIRQRMAGIRREAEALRGAVVRRAVRAYKNTATPVDFVLDGRDIAGVTRGAKLLDAANARDGDAVAALRSLNDDLSARRAELEANREQQTAALDDLRAAQRQVDANLRAAVADESAVSARLAAQAAAEQAARRAAAASASSAGSGAASRVKASSSAPASPQAPPAPDYSPRAGVHPHHDDPFLACTRARESNGQYGVVNPSGPYLGAYQFLQSTWNLTAQRAGRSELVGVPPNQASEYDQDDMAWSLYQSQGNGPWGGLC